MMSPRQHSEKFLDKLRKGLGGPNPPKAKDKHQESAGVPEPQGSQEAEGDGSAISITSIYSDIMEAKEGSPFFIWWKHILNAFGMEDHEAATEKRAFVKEIYEFFGPETAFEVMESCYPNKAPQRKKKKKLDKSSSITRKELDRHETRRSSVLPDGKVLSGALHRVSSEERLSTLGDQVLSPREMEIHHAEKCGKWERRKENASPIGLACSSTTTTSSEAEVDGDGEAAECPPPPPSRRGTICRSVFADPPLIPDELSLLNMCAMYSSKAKTHVRKRSPSVDRNRDVIVRHPIRTRSRSIERESSGSSPTLARQGSESTNAGKDKEEGECLSPRDRSKLNAKKTSEQRLCRQTMFTVSGGMFIDEEGRAVYRDIKGIRVSDDEAIVMGALHCTFTGHRMILKDIDECQVLGRECQVEGSRNFIRGRQRSVTGFGNFVVSV
jgi:hypothetical protein